MNQLPVCAIAELEKLHENINDSEWATPNIQKHMAAGVQLAIVRLTKAGFVKVSGEELAIEPIQFDLPIGDYGTLHSYK